MPCLNHSELEFFANALADGIRAELYLTPKPGLVDLCDTGAHSDLSLLKMTLSARMLHEYLLELADALSRRRPLSEQQQLGRKAEQRMLHELGSNCHRGGIFLTGLLLSAYAEAGSDDPELLSAAVAAVARLYFQQTRTEVSNGQRARERFRTGGIISEALAGLPGLFRVALPSLLASSDDFGGGCFLAMARLMQHCDDTTTLHRGGQTGLARLRKAGQELERCLQRGNAPEPLLHRLNRDFIAANLTMGGVADLLGLSFGYFNLRIANQGLPTHSVPHLRPASCPA